MNYKLYWSPTGQHIQHIATVTATDPRNAIRQAPKPYRKYLGEIYAIELPDSDIETCLSQSIDDIRRDIARHNSHDRTVR